MQKIGQNGFRNPAPQTRGFLTGTYYAAKWRLINPPCVTDSIVCKRSANWWVFDHRSEASDSLCRMAGLDGSRRFAQTKDIKAMFSKAKPAQRPAT